MPDIGFRHLILRCQLGERHALGTIFLYSSDYFTRVSSIICHVPIIVQGRLWTRSHVINMCTIKDTPQTLGREEFAEALFVEADDEVAAHRDDGHAHLAALLYHFLTLGEVGRDVVVREVNFVGAEKVFRHVAKVARRGRVNGYLLFCSHSNV